MSRLLPALVVALTAFLSACGGGGGGGDGGPTITPSTRVARSALPPGDTTCPAGGILVQTGFDVDGDLVLDSAEVVDSEKVCNGTAGIEALVVTTDISAGGMCGPQAGVQVDAGLDADDDGLLDGSEIARTSYVCDGAAGTDGIDAFQTLIEVTDEGPGTCPAGGALIRFGLDLDADGQFDLPAELVKSTRICHGVDGNDGHDSLVAVSSESPNPLTCPTGGQKLQSGLDDDGDGALDVPAEVDATAYVCNGAAAEAGLNSVVNVTDIAPGDATCANGGKLVATGLDDDRDGTLDAGEIDATNKVCHGIDGTDGYNSLVTVSDEAPDPATCPAGGSRIDTGLDLDRDSLLDSTEITSTSYVCKGFPTLLATEIHPELCLHGATVLKSGLDSNMSGVLDASEVASTSTICQNNAAPSLAMLPTEDPYGVLPDGLLLSSWVGNAAVHDPLLRTWEVALYNHAAVFGFTFDDPNGDPLALDVGTLPILALDALPPELAAALGSDGFHLQMPAGAPAGTYELPMSVDDSEAFKDYTLRLDVRDAHWSYVSDTRHEGVDTWATATVSFPQPLLWDMELNGASLLEFNWTPDEVFQCVDDWMTCQDQQPALYACLQDPGPCLGGSAMPSDLEICIDGQPCAPATATTPVNTCILYGCIDLYPAATFTLPAGTTSFSIRRPITDDATWGNNGNLTATLGLRRVGGSWHDVFAPLDVRFRVIDNETPPTVSFVDALLTLTSGGNGGTVQVTSSIFDILVPVLVSGTAVEGQHYTGVIDWVSIDGSGNGWITLSTPLNEDMTGPVSLDIVFDPDYGLDIGTNGATQVTILPPPPLTAGFDAPTLSFSRYEGYGCATVTLNRISYIQAVTFNVEVLGGTAVEGEDYWPMFGTDGAVTIDPGAPSANVCVTTMPETEVLEDRTIDLGITNLSGALAGTNVTQQVTLTGGEWPAVDFVAAGNSDLLDTGIGEACAGLELSGLEAPLDVYATVRATPSDPALGDYLGNSGFWPNGDGTWSGQVYFNAAWNRTGTVCLVRPWSETLPAGDFTVTYEVTGVTNGHVGTTQPSTTFHVSGSLPTVSFVDTLLELISGDSGALRLVSDVAYAYAYLEFQNSPSWAYQYYTIDSYVQFDENGEATLDVFSVFSEYLADTLYVDISIRPDGVFPGAATTARVYIYPIPPPDIDFGAAEYNALADTGTHSDCLHVNRTTPVAGGTNFTVRALTADPLLGEFLVDNDFTAMGGGMYDYTGYFPQYGVNTLEVCFYRPMYAALPVGDHAIEFTLTGVDYGQVGSTQPTTTLHYTQDYGTRDLSPVLASGWTNSNDSLIAADGSVTRLGDLFGRLEGQVNGGGRDVYVVHLNPDGARWQLQLGTANDEIVSSREVDVAGNAVLLVESYAAGWTYAGSTLYGIGNDGVIDWSLPWAVGEVMTSHGGVTLASDTLAGDFSAITAAGTVAWTLDATDFGVTGCTLPPSFGALPVGDTGDWYVAVMPPAGSGCVLPDVDGDAVTYTTQLARVAADGSVVWRLDDWAEAGGTALSAPDIRAETDAAGNLYLAFSEAPVHQLAKVLPAGSVAWLEDRPACGGCTTDMLLDFSVAPTGVVAASWVVDGGFSTWTNHGYGTDVGVWALDASGATLFDALLGAAPNDESAWLIARDDSTVLLQMTQDGYQGPVLLDGVLETQVEQGIQSNTGARGLAGGDTLLVYSHLAAERRGPDFVRK